MDYLNKCSMHLSEYPRRIDETLTLCSSYQVVRKKIFGNSNSLLLSFECALEIIPPIGSCNTMTQCATNLLQSLRQIHGTVRSCFYYQTTPKISYHFMLKIQKKIGHFQGAFDYPKSQKRGFDLTKVMVLTIGLRAKDLKSLLHFKFMNLKSNGERACLGIHKSQVVRST